MSTVEKKPYIHLSIDDTFEIFKDLAQNAMYYSSKSLFAFFRDASHAIRPRGQHVLLHRRRGF